MRSAQYKLREGSVSIGSEMLRCAQHDNATLRTTGLDLAGGEELSSSCEPCLSKQIDILPRETPNSKRITRNAEYFASYIDNTFLTRISGNERRQFYYTPHINVLIAGMVKK